MPCDEAVCGYETVEADGVRGRPSVRDDAAA